MPVCACECGWMWVIHGALCIHANKTSTLHFETYRRRDTPWAPSYLPQTSSAAVTERSRMERCCGPAPPPLPPPPLTYRHWLMHLPQVRRTAPRDQSHAQTRIPTTTTTATTTTTNTHTTLHGHRWAQALKPPTSLQSIRSCCRRAQEDCPRKPEEAHDEGRGGGVGWGR